MIVKKVPFVLTMGGLKGSKIALLKKKVWVPFSIYFEGLKGSELALVRQNVLLFIIMIFFILYDSYVFMYCLCKNKKSVTSTHTIVNRTQCTRLTWFTNANFILHEKELQPTF